MSNDTTTQVKIEDAPIPSVIVDSEHREDNNITVNKTSLDKQQEEIKKSQPVDNYEPAGRSQPTYNVVNDYNSSNETQINRNTMDNTEVFNIGLYSIIIIIALLTIGLIFSRLYKRASKEISFVRTGFGGQKVIMDGGALVLPVLHETIAVNMNTLR